MPIRGPGEFAVSSAQYEHLHNHYLWIQEQLRELQERMIDLETALRDIAQLEIIASLKEMSSMVKQSEKTSNPDGPDTPTTAPATEEPAPVDEPTPATEEPVPTGNEPATEEPAQPTV